MTFALSIVTDEVSQDLAECGAFLAEHELDAVEVRTVNGVRVPDLATADVETLAAWRADGTAIHTVSPGLFKCDVDDRATIRRHLHDALPRALELATLWHAPFVIAFSGENPTGAPVPGHVVQALHDAAAQCAAAGVELLIENEPGFVACTGRDLDRLVDAVNHPACKVNWDPCNSNETSTEDLAASVGAALPHIRHVHVKNGTFTPGERFPKYGPLRKGAIDWPRHLHLLRDLGYRGRLGIETHYEPLRDASHTVVTELREMLAKLPPPPTSPSS